MRVVSRLVGPVASAARRARRPFCPRPSARSARVHGLTGEPSSATGLSIFCIAAARADLSSASACGKYAKARATRQSQG